MYGMCPESGEESRGEERRGEEWKKSRIQETKNLLTNADSRTDTILERLRDLSQKNKIKYI